MNRTKIDKQEEFLVNDRFIVVMDHLVEIRKCRDYGDFWQQLGFTTLLPQRTQKIKSYHQKVPLSLLLLVGSVFKVNINYLLGFETKMFRGKN